jgi:hypothetical protein
MSTTVNKTHCSLLCCFKKSFSHVSLSISIDNTFEQGSYVSQYFLNRPVLDFCASNGEMGVHIQAFLCRGVYSESDVRQDTLQVSCCDLMGELLRHYQVMELIKQAPEPLPSIDI